MRPDAGRSSSTGRGANSTSRRQPIRRDEQLRFTVPPERGPPTEVLTFDFPEVRPAATTLRFRWGTVVVPLAIAAIPPPLALLPSRTT